MENPIVAVPLSMIPSNGKPQSDGGGLVGRVELHDDAPEHEDDGRSRWHGEDDGGVVSV